MPIEDLPEEDVEAVQDAVGRWSPRRPGNGPPLETIEPDGQTSALALPAQLDDALNQKLSHLSDVMKLRWEEERKEREKWTEEDKYDNARVRLAAMFGAAILSESTAGRALNAKQIAHSACEHADALLEELAKTRKQRKR